MHSDEEIERAIKGLSEMGRLIEGGWLAYRLKVVPMEASAVQVHECRLAFYAGAAHLFYGILAAMDDGVEDTEADLEKMNLIDVELKSFQIEMIKKMKGPQ